MVGFLRPVFCSEEVRSISAKHGMPFASISYQEVSAEFRVIAKWVPAGIAANARGG